MDTFTASNGTQVKTRDSSGREDGTYIFLKTPRADEFHPIGNWRTFSANSPIGESLAEFFRHREDQRLGRWRWPENPDYVVYVSDIDPDLITVMRESNGRIRTVRRGNTCLETDYSENFGSSAVAYFDAHPVKKPWHDAQQNELWVLTLKGCGDPEVYQIGTVAYRTSSRVFRPVNNPNRISIDPTDPLIEDAVRLWPTD